MGPTVGIIALRDRLEHCRRLWMATLQRRRESPISRSQVTLLATTIANCPAMHAAVVHDAGVEAIANLFCVGLLEQISNWQGRPRHR